MPNYAKNCECEVGEGVATQEKLKNRYELLRKQKQAVVQKVPCLIT